MTTFGVMMSSPPMRMITALQSAAGVKAPVLVGTAARGYIALRATLANPDRNLCSLERIFRGLPVTCQSKDTANGGADLAPYVMTEDRLTKHSANVRHKESSWISTGVPVRVIDICALAVLRCSLREMQLLNDASKSVME